MGGDRKKRVALDCISKIDMQKYTEMYNSTIKNGEKLRRTWDANSGGGVGSPNLASSYAEMGITSRSTSGNNH